MVSKKLGDLEDPPVSIGAVKTRYIELHARSICRIDGRRRRHRGSGIVHLFAHLLDLGGEESNLTCKLNDGIWCVWRRVSHGGEVTR